MPGIASSPRPEAQSSQAASSALRPAATASAPGKGQEDDSQDIWERARYFIALRIHGAPTPRLVGQMFSIGGNAYLECSFLHDTSREMARALGSLRKSLPAGPERDTLQHLQVQLTRASRWGEAIKKDVRRTPDEQAANPSPPAQVIAEMRAALQAEARVLLPATVTGLQCSHGMLVEVRRQLDGRYLLRIFNSAFLDPLQHGIGDTGMLQGHTDFGDVPADVVHSAQFVQELVALNYATHRPAIDNVAALYDWAYAHSTRLRATGEMHHQQTVPNCSWKCVSGYVRLNLPRVLYLHLKAEHRAQVLAEYDRRARVPAWVYQWVKCGSGEQPESYACMPVGWSWQLRALDAPLLALAHEQLKKTQRRLSEALEKACEAATPARRAR